MRHKSQWIALFGLLWVVALGVACGGGEGEAAVDLSLIATDITYDEDRLEVPVNEPVHLTLKNEGALVHDFTIRHIDVADVHAPEAVEDDHDMSHEAEKLALHVSAPVGDSGTLEFTPLTAGEYEYYCTVPGHKEAGMVGTLVVTP